MIAHPLLLAHVVILFAVQTMAAQAEERLGIYREAKSKGAEATPFTVRSAAGLKDRSGFYAGAPLLTLADVATISSGYEEVGSKPVPALHLGFTAEGYRRLGEHLKDRDAADLVIAIEGRVYGTLPTDELRVIVQKRTSLVLLIDTAVEKPAELDRLEQKLKARAR